MLMSRNKELEVMLIKLQAKIENDAGIEATRFVQCFLTWFACVNKNVFAAFAIT